MYIENGARSGDFDERLNVLPDGRSHLPGDPRGPVAEQEDEGHDDKVLGESPVAVEEHEGPQLVQELVHGAGEVIRAEVVILHSEPAIDQRVETQPGHGVVVAVQAGDADHRGHSAESELMHQHSGRQTEQLGVLWVLFGRVSGDAVAVQLVVEHFDGQPQHLQDERGEEDGRVDDPAVEERGAPLQGVDRVEEAGDEGHDRRDDEHLLDEGERIAFAFLNDERQEIEHADGEDAQLHVAHAAQHSDK